MVRTTDLVGHRYAIRDIVHCSNCRSPLDLSGEHFACPNAQSAGAGRCPNPPVNADTLLRAVVGQLVTRIINPTTTRELIKGDMEVYGPKFTLKKG